jgi:hypothetical protein
MGSVDYYLSGVGTGPCSDLIDQRDDPITGSPLLDGDADLLDNAGHVPAKHLRKAMPRCERREMWRAAAGEQVDRVDCRCEDPDAGLGWTDCG